MCGNRKRVVVLLAFTAVGVHANGQRVGGETYVEGRAEAALELVDDVGGPAIVLLGDRESLVCVGTGERLAEFMEGAGFASAVVAGN